MSDLALQWDPVTLTADLVLDREDLAVDEGMRTAIILSLFTDRRAEPGDVVPVGSEADLRGWWGDSVPPVAGDRIGSRLWLLARSKGTPDVLERAREYAREALAWLVEDDVAEEIEVEAEAQERGLVIAVVVRRPSGAIVSYEFGRVWAAEEAR